MHGGFVKGAERPPSRYILAKSETFLILPLFYAQNRCFPMVRIRGLDQIQALVAVLGLK